MKIPRKTLIKIIAIVTIAIIAVASSLLIVEISLRYFSKIKYGYNYYLWPPYITRTITIRPQVMPGVSGQKQFSINSIGIRGNEPSSHNNYKILALGGSTTESGYLDDSQTWPQLLQNNLNQNSNSKIWVGNAGRRGSTLRDNILHLEYFVSQLKDLDTIILLVGVNDFMYGLSTEFKPFDTSTIKKPTINQLDHAFFIHPYTKSGFKGTAIWSFAKQIKVTYFGRKVLHFNEEEAITFWRRKRKNADGIIHELPDLSKQLQDYENNLNTFINMAKTNTGRIIILTQPNIWKKQMSEEELNLLWFGCIEKNGWQCYSPEALEKGMNLFNGKAKEACEKKKVECLDLASIPPKDTSIFADEVHFNENGAREVAKILSDYLKSKPPFGQ